MKKILLRLGLLTAAVLPVFAVVSCSLKIENKNSEKNETNMRPGVSKNTGEQNNGKSSSNGANQILNVGGDSQTPINQNHNAIGDSQIITQSPGVKQNGQSTEIQFTSLTDFTVSEVSEDAFLPGFLKDIDHSIRDFRVYDNGLFKIKIEKKLIGPNDFYASNEKADLQAKEIAKQINIGPAVTHMEKGVQILFSDDVASLGGHLGLQIAVNNKFGSANDEGIRSETSLIAHEYGHHETLWDFQNITGGTNNLNLKDVFINALKKIGYPEIAHEVSKSTYDPSKPNQDPNALNFGDAVPTDFPTAYGAIHTSNHKIFEKDDYPFDAPEIATRMLNILSFTTTLSAQDIYKNGGSGSFTKGYTFEPPAYLVSDATFRHFTGDSVFGNGKDDSRVKDLIKFYMDEIFGLGTGGISIEGDVNNGTINKINLDSFGLVDDLDSIELKDTSGKVVGSHKVESFNSRFNFKNELLSSDTPYKYRQSVKTLDDFNLGLAPELNDNSGFAFSVFDGYTIIGKDAKGNPVDISKLKIKEMTNKVNGQTQIFTGFRGLSVQGDHFVIDSNANDVLSA